MVGWDQYLEHCPQNGCLAVALNEEGAVSESWPYRPAEIYSADITDGRYPRETSLGFDPLTHVYPTSVQRYANGDILVNFSVFRRRLSFRHGRHACRFGWDAALDSL